MSIYHSNRKNEYKIKIERNKMYINKLGKMIEKRSILIKEIKEIDNTDGTVESYEYDPYLHYMKNRLISIEGNIRSLRKKVKRTE